jgi:hypothetical protein
MYNAVNNMPRMSIQSGNIVISHRQSLTEAQAANPEPARDTLTNWRVIQ